MRATVFLWEAAGRPVPRDPSGAPLAKTVSGKTCASCGCCDAEHTISQVISDNFTTVRNANRAWQFGGPYVCRACAWCCRAWVLRSAMFFARLPDANGIGGIWFSPLRPIPGFNQVFREGRFERPDPLAAIVNPPPPPFVAGLPLFGIDHGGEANGERCLFGAEPTDKDLETAKAFVESAIAIFGRSLSREESKLVRVALATGSTRAPLDVPGAQSAWEELLAECLPWTTKPWWRWAVNPLIKLQSKHTALYCRVSTRADIYHLQIDDANDVVVDVPLWRHLKVSCERILVVLRSAGVGSVDAVKSLRTLHPPSGTPLGVHARWATLVEPLRPHNQAPWWPLFTDLLRVPALTKKAS